MDGDGFFIEIAFIGFLIILNGFFAGAEIAVVTASRARALAAAEAGDGRARVLLALKGDPDRFLATVQIGVTVVGTLASAVGGAAAVERIEPLFATLIGPAFAEPAAVGTVVVVIAYVSLVAGELVPKSLAVRRADAIALRIARPIDWLSRATRPVITFLTASGRMLLRLVGHSADARSPFHTLDDLRAMVDEAAAQGVVPTDLLQGAIAFHDREVREVMTPHHAVVSIPSGATMKDAARATLASGHSRFPVVDADLDHVRGILYAVDLYEAMLAGRETALAPLLREPHIVPATKSAASLLEEMRRRREHIAVVVDEHGRVLGLVTLEDLVEVIVGDIADERQAEAVRVIQVSEREYDVSGDVPLHELADDHGLELPSEGRTTSVAGLVLDHLGRMAVPGDEVRVGVFVLRVLRVERNRVARLRIRRDPELPPPDGRGGREPGGTPSRE